MNVPGERFKDFDKIRFTFNNTSFDASDTTIKSIHLNKGLDNGIAIIGKDTLRFFTRFKPNEAYMIQPGCCCAAFTLTAVNNPGRGIVSFKNPLKRGLVLVVAEANSDTVDARRTRSIFAHESVMCTFKPCSIQVTELAYLDEKYNFETDKRNYDSLWSEQAKLVLGTTWFHFLHGEKVAVSYSEKTGKLKLELIGYVDPRSAKSFMQ